MKVQYFATHHLWEQMQSQRLTDGVRMQVEHARNEQCFTIIDDISMRIVVGVLAERERWRSDLALLTVSGDVSDLKVHLNPFLYNKLTNLDLLFELGDSTEATA